MGLASRIRDTVKPYLMILLLAALSLDKTKKNLKTINIIKAHNLRPEL